MWLFLQKEEAWGQIRTINKCDYFCRLSRAQIISPHYARERERKRERDREKARERERTRETERERREREERERKDKKREREKYKWNIARKKKITVKLVETLKNAIFSYIGHYSSENWDNIIF
jgi:hypothetical protein